MIRVKGTGEPAAFELVNPLGSLSHQFTQPAHRLKGLGAAVEQQLCVKLIKKGMVPSKNVEYDNLNVVRSADKNPYWTKRVDSEGHPITMAYYRIKKKESPVLNSLI